MERDRWPDQVVAFVDAASCPRCGAPRERVMVTVQYVPPAWLFIINCPGCDTRHRTEWIDMFGQLRPKPPEPVTPEPTPLPAWALALEKELR